jgi:hypothetical protein
MPKTIDGWIGWLVALSITGLTIYAAQTDPTPLWCAIALGVLGTLGTLLKGGGVSLKGKTAAGPIGGTLFLLVLSLVFVIGATSCKGPYDAAWRTLDGVIRARDTTAQGLATHAKSERERCLKAHGPKTEAGAACIKPTREALAAWRTIARPAINSALQVTAASLQIAERAKADKPPDWLTLLRPAVCALLRAAKSWGHWYPDKGKAILTALNAAAEVTCE